MLTLLYEWGRRSDALYVTQAVERGRKYREKRVPDN